MQNLLQNKKWLQIGWDFIQVIIGATIIGLSFNLFLFPNDIASGGISGFSTVLHELFAWVPAYVQWAFNIPLFLAGLYLLGRGFALKTIVGTFFLPFVILITDHLDAVTMDPLLAALFGGIGVGLGLGIVFRGKGSTGGTDLAAQILHKYTRLSLGLCVAIMDGIVVLSAAFVFNPEKGLYALIALFVTSRTINLVQVGVDHSKMALIITNKEDEVKKGILHDIDRGLTKLSGYGGYTDEKRCVLMTVIEQAEFTKLKQLVKSIDPEAFVVVMEASEVLGEGFKR